MKMTIRGAWLRLAEAWDKAKEGEDGFVEVYIGRQRSLGLCNYLNFLLYSEAIDRCQWQEMHETIVKQQQLPNAYCWSLDEVGARARAAFCREQAAKLA
jgi:hypothetical protein